MVGVLFGFFLESPGSPGQANTWQVVSPALDVAIHLALVELAMAAVIALACALTLFLAGIITTADLSRIMGIRAIRRARVIAETLPNEPINTLESVIGLQDPRHT
jgi:hypothetical protein